MPWCIVLRPSWWTVEDVRMPESRWPPSFCLDVPGQISQHVPSSWWILHGGQWEHVQEGPRWMYGIGWSQIGVTGDECDSEKCNGWRSRQ